MGHVVVERKGPAAWAILNRPEKLNSLNRELMNELINIFKELDRDHEAKVLVLTGRGKAFSAGIDLGEVAEAEDPEEASSIFRKLAELFRTLLALEKPLIMAVNGHAYGGGAELLWAADVVVAVKGARIAWPEAKWGLVPPILPTLGALVLGPARAALLAMTGKPLTAEEAYSMGLVSVLAEDLEDLEVKVGEVVRSVLSYSPGGVRSVKKLLRQVKATSLAELGISELERLAMTSDTRYAAKMFKAKKEPTYKW